MSQLKKIQSSLLEMKSIYALAAIAMLLALRIVLGFFANSTLPFFGNNVKLSAAFLPIAVTGVMFGPFLPQLLVLWEIFFHLSLLRQAHISPALQSTALLQVLSTVCFFIRTM